MENIATRPRKGPEYATWSHMRDRCYNQRSQDYANYGGRGIVVCERWESYDNFLTDVGRKPGPGYSLDRIDNEAAYSPGNCRWATKAEQAQNQRRTRLDADKVNEIRGRSEHGEGVVSLAQRFSVSRCAIRKVLKRRSWKDVP